MPPTLCHAAEEERKKVEEKERMAKLDAIAAKQRQRDLEAEEKLRQEKEEALAKAASRPAPFVSRAAQASRGGAGEAPPGRDDRGPTADRWTSSRSREPDVERRPERRAEADGGDRWQRREVVERRGEEAPRRDGPPPAGGGGRFTVQPRTNAPGGGAGNTSL